MRFSGAVLLWAAFTLTGMRMSLLLKKRETLLVDTLSFLNVLSVSIEYSRTDLMRIITDVAKENRTGNFPLLEICSSEFEKGSDFPLSWAKAVNTAHLYKRCEKEKLLQLGSILGTSDSKNQISIINTYISHFNRFYQSASDDYNRYGKVSSLFGMFSGAAIFILLF